MNKKLAAKKPAAKKPAASQQAVIHNTHPGNKKGKGGTDDMEMTMSNKNKKRPGLGKGRMDQYRGILLCMRIEIGEVKSLFSSFMVQ